MKQHAIAAARPPRGVARRTPRLAALLSYLRDGQAHDSAKYSAAAAVVADAISENDEDTLVAGQRALQSAYARDLARGEGDGHMVEDRGRILGLLDVVNWSLRRITPASALGRLTRGTTERRLLEVLVDEPKYTDAELAEALGVNVATVDAVTTGLQAAGLVRSGAVRDYRIWDITPRGREALLFRLSLRLDPEGVRRVAEEILEPDRATARGRRRRSVTSGIVAVLLTADEPLSVEELADETRHTVRRVKLGVDALFDRGILQRHEGEMERFTVRDDRHCVIGIEIFQHRVDGIVAGLRGEPLHTEGRDLHKMNPESVADAVADVVQSLRSRIAETHPSATQLLGVGIEMGGHIDSGAGTVVLSPNVCVGGEPWRGVALGDLIRQRTGLTTVIENDVDALAIHQQLYGALGKERDDFAVIAIEDGVGAGLVIRGDVVHGPRGRSGEIGHLVVQPGGAPCGCGNRGCIEAYAAIPNIIRACARPGENDAPSSLEEAVTRALNGDERARDAFISAGEALGRGVAALENLFAPRAVLIAVPHALSPDRAPQPGVTHPTRLFENELRKAASRDVFSSTDSEIVIRHVPRLAQYRAQGAAAALLRRFVEFPLQWPGAETVPGERSEAEGFETSNGRDIEPRTAVAETNVASSDLVRAVDDALVAAMG